MKKTIISFFLIILAASAYSQAGDVYVGAQGGYATKYKDFMYGLSVAYDVSAPLQISLTALMNPSMTEKAEYDWDKDQKLQLYSTNLDARFFLINLETWSTGPSVGAQYLIAKYKENDLRDYNAWGVNIGWHIRVSLTDNLRLNGGWRYTTAQEGASHNLFYLGIGYAFNVF